MVMQLPRLMLVRQKFPDRRIPDVAAEVHEQLNGSAFASRLKPGSRVAIGVGSRGIHQHRHHRAERGGVLERAMACGRSCSRPWEATARPRRRARPTCWRITASPKPPWAARW